MPNVTSFGQAESKDLFGHPRGLFFLFFTEFWERFSFYGMRALLTLYIIAESTGANPGLGWTTLEALKLYGWYTMAAYLTCVPGGILADRYLGQKKTVFLGGMLLVFGHLTLAINQLWAFYAGLVLIVMGIGGLKPNISTLVGSLYRDDDPRRDFGFVVFYIGINMGAFVSSILVGYVGEVMGWHYGFGLAGIGMVLGQVVFIMGSKHYRDLDAKASTNIGPASAPLTAKEWDRVYVLLLSFLITIAFWGAFEQAGGLMNIYAKEKIDRIMFGWEVPASVFQAANPMFIMMFGALVGGFWLRRQRLGKETSSLYKMGIGVIIMSFGFLLLAFAAIEAEASPTHKAMLFWLFGAYFFHTIGELCLSPVALSFITKLAPVKYGSLMMGLYWAATGLGDKVAGLIGESAASLGELQIFVSVFVFEMVVGILVLLALPRLKALTHGAEDEALGNHISEESHGSLEEIPSAS